MRIQVTEGPGFDGVRAIVRQIRSVEYGEEIILVGSRQALSLMRLMRLMRLDKVATLQEVS